MAASPGEEPKVGSPCLIPPQWLKLVPEELRFERVPLLPAPPVDPFTGGPLGYSREWKLLWSAGPEGKEDGRQGLLDKDGDPRPFLWPIRNPAAENR